MATILELKREAWLPYIQAKKDNQPTQLLSLEAERSRDELLRRIKDLAQTLKKEFAVKRVILFGSLAHAAWFMPNSDLDLAVEGLAPHDFWAAWKVAEQAIPERSVDLVDLDSANKTLCESIAKHGIEL